MQNGKKDQKNQVLTNISDTEKCKDILVWLKKILSLWEEHIKKHFGEGESFKDTAEGRWNISKL